MSLAEDFLKGDYKSDDFLELYQATQEALNTTMKSDGRNFGISVGDVMRNLNIGCYTGHEFYACLLLMEKYGLLDIKKDKSTMTQYYTIHVKRTYDIGQWKI